ncbi:hypothetical protein CLOM_g2240 [Closterium sp. NIES-68]|nr:hypothetical protein CLOM_g2240 [Closterium sp. NIES-68]
MELKPFGIQVMLVAPGAIRSNFGGNSSSSVSHLQLKIFSRFQTQIEARAGASQTPQSTPGDVFARALVEKALAKRVPIEWAFGHLVSSFRIMTWLPYSFRDSALMKKFGLTK